MRSHEVRAELVEVDLDDPVEEALRIGEDLGVGLEVLGVAVGKVGERFAARRLEIHRRVVVVREQ